MNENEAIRTMLDRSGLSQTRASLMMGKSPSWLSASLAHSGCGASTLARIADVCGYELALVPKGGVPDGGLVIDPRPKGEYLKG